MISLVSIKIDEDVRQTVDKVLQSGQLAEGPVVKEFEDSFAAYNGTPYAVAVNSGTAALHLALLAAGIKPGDEVISTTFSFIATANCCLYCGAVPVFIDIDYDTYNMNPDDIEAKITPKTKAVLITHLYGQPCDMDKIVSICKKHGLILIEDACQAHGAEYKNRKTGNFGIGCFSFYATKNLMTGEGGMITTADEKTAAKMKAMRNHGRSGQYLHDTLGFNYRMTDIAAAIGIGHLKKLDDHNARRNKNAAFLTEEISKIPGLIPPVIGPDRTHAFHQYTIRITKDFGITRDELQARLKELEIVSNVIYPVPIHLQPLYKQLGYTDSLPVSEQAASEVLSIPVHQDLTESDLKTIVQGLNNAR
ncbi:MAG: DegT/DnrJ/EryC1/StrS family aminotransferase [Dehalococcoidales bacterium]|nr:DegT/DnrJ/EryC1/StrS family aminotransferase [Dehalococcoidales bacterium]